MRWATDSKERSRFAEIIMTILDINSLYVEISQPILRGVSLQIKEGEVHGLVGESGAGKTMVGKCVLGLLPEQIKVTHGFINFAGQELLKIDAKELRDLLGRDLALIPQNPMTALNPVRRIEPQITDVLQLHLGMSRVVASQRAAELLNDVHIRDVDRVRRQFPHELSGGMLQRVLIAIAFACKPKLIIADEPTTALDVTVQRQILRLIKELQSSSNTAILFISHDFGVVAKICNRVSVIHSGRILESNTVAELFARPQHPYTRALLAATPRFDRPAAALHPVPSQLIDALWNEAHAHDNSGVNAWH
jgi:peptide/nickel transport system ATP-binding protein